MLLKLKSKVDVANVASWLSGEMEKKTCIQTILLTQVPIQTLFTQRANDIMRLLSTNT